MVATGKDQQDRAHRGARDADAEADRRDGRLAAERVDVRLLGGGAGLGGAVGVEVDLDPSAIATPKTVPTASPTPPTTKPAMAATVRSVACVGEGGATLACTGATTAGVVSGGGAATATALGSASSFSATADSAPSRTATVVVTGLYPAALATTSCDPGSVGRSASSNAAGTSAPSTVTESLSVGAPST